MNFYNEDEKKAGIPVIPGAASPFRKTSAFGKAPMFSRAAGGFVDRLKNLSRRDMAFVAIGLSVLVMAPVAEYMISQPSQDNVLKGNEFSVRSADGPFEPGIHGLSQGSADGSGEVITPLTARDPASLILGSQSSQPVLPPAVTAPPSSSWRDAVTDSGRAAFSAATKSAGVPTVIPKMQAGLRGFTSFGGDGSSRTSGTLGGGKIIDDAKSSSSKAAKRSMIGPVAMAGYKGVASGTPNSASKGAFEKLRGQADKSASNFSGGSAMNSLDKAAADAVQLGAGTGGAGGLGEGEKTKGGNNYDNKYKHERSGESLAEAAAKARQQKALEWEFFKKYEIKKTIVNAVVNAFATTLGEFISGNMKSALGMSGGGAPEYVCLTQIRPLPETDPLFCDLKTNTKIKDRSSDEKTITNWNGGNTRALCPCGVKKASEYNAVQGGGAETGTGNNTTGGAGSGTGNGTPEQIAAESKSFDEALFAILQNAGEGVDNYDNGKKLFKNSSAITNSQSGLTGLFAMDNSPFAVLSRGIATDVNSFQGKLNTFNAEISQAESKNSESLSAADKLIKDVDAKLGTDIRKDGSVAVDTEDTESMQVELRKAKAAAEKIKVEVSSRTKSLAFLGKAAGFYADQVDVVRSAVLAMRTSGDAIRGISEGEAEVLNGITEDKANEKKAEVQGSFDKLWKQQGEGDAATASGAVRNALDLRGAKKVDEWKMNDDDSVKNEATAWDAASPRFASERQGGQEGFAGARLPIETNIAAVIKRAKFELHTDLEAIKLDPTTIKGDSNNAIARIAQIRADLKLDPAATPGGTGPGTDTPASTTTVTGGGNGSGSGSGVTNAATARADSVLSDGTQRMALNQPVMDGINSKSDNCTSTECKGRLADARTAMGDMTTKIGEIQELQRKAMQPGANVAQLDAEIQQKQRELHAADTRFDEASKRVAALEGYRPPKPPSQPTAGQIAKQEDINKAEFHVRAIDACYVGTSGFKTGASARCERELATRTATTVLTARAWRGDVISSNDAAYRATLLRNLANERGTAYGWASTCLRTIPSGCSR